MVDSKALIINIASDMTKTYQIDPLSHGFASPKQSLGDYGAEAP
jgi:hypothetical protein